MSDIVSRYAARAVLFAGLAWAASYTAAAAQTVFTGVAAGDMTAGNAILWTQTSIGTTVALTAQIATDAGFTNIVQTLTGATVVDNGSTLKLSATGLANNTQYFYRFTDGTTTSQVGQFSTMPAANQRVAFKMGFSGDVDAKWRPYTAMAGFGTAANPGSVGLNAFIFLGDTIYEKGANGSPALPKLTASPRHPA